MVMEVFVSKYIRGSVKIFSSGVKQTWVPTNGRTSRVVSGMLPRCSESWLRHLQNGHNVPTQN